MLQASELEPIVYINF